LTKLNTTTTAITIGATGTTTCAGGMTAGTVITTPTGAAATTGHATTMAGAMITTATGVITTTPQTLFECDLN